MEDRERSKLGEVERIGENLKSDGIKKIFFDMDSTLVKTAEGFQESIWEFSGWIAEEGGLEMEEVNEKYMETIVGLRGEFSVRPEISGATMEIVRRWCVVLVRLSVVLLPSEFWLQTPQSILWVVA